MWWLFGVSGGWEPKERINTPSPTSRCKWSVFWSVCRHAQLPQTPPHRWKNIQEVCVCCVQFKAVTCKHKSSFSSAFKHKLYHIASTNKSETMIHTLEPSRAWASCTLRVFHGSGRDSTLTYVPSICHQRLSLHPFRLVYSSQILYFIFPVPLMTQMCWKTKRETEKWV